MSFQILYLNISNYDLHFNNTSQSPSFFDLTSDIQLHAHLRVCASLSYAFMVGAALYSHALFSYNNFVMDLAAIPVSLS